MMRQIFFTILVFLGSFYISFSQNIDLKTAQVAANNHILLKGYHSTHRIIDVEAVSNNKEKLFYCFDLSPQGYIIISASKKITPVVAFSFLNNINKEGPFFSLLNTDIDLRLKNNDQKLFNKNIEKWQKILTTNKREINNQVWPPSGSTPTGGWLESNWTQNAPYNNMCPMDNVNSARSLAGCPAVAMGMIINFHKTTNGVYFDNNDDYYHNYSGRQYWIDDDYLANDFPSFPELNDYLDTLNNNYQNEISLTDQDKSALVFACGVACTQVFTSSVSGTFGVSQAFAAYQKFNFNNIAILYDGDTTIETRLAQNMMDTLPAHLALVDSGWTMGHNVVVDGYDSDGYFHLNFGWGGSSNGWYVIPSGIPYNLTVVEGLILDIYPDNATNTVLNDNKETVVIYPNPTSATVYISLDKLCGVDIFNDLGKKIFSVKGNVSEINLKNFEKGIYLIRATTQNSVVTRKIILK